MLSIKNERRSHRASAFCASSIISLVPVVALGQTAYIIGLGTLDPREPGSEAMGVSADGWAVAGYSAVPGLLQTRAFRWTPQDGMVAIAPTDSDGRGISSDGEVVVGFISPQIEGYYWSSRDGVVTLGDLPGNEHKSLAYAANGDGSVIVGYSSSDRAVNLEAFRWTAEEGMIGLGGLNPNKIYSIAFDVTPDGMFIVGRTEDEYSAAAFRWTDSDGMQSIGRPPGGRATYAYAVSPDGSVIVGRSDIVEVGWEAFAWTTKDGCLSIGEIPGGRHSSEADDVSANGWIIVGTSQSVDYDHAVVWTTKRGILDLNEVLANEFGVDMSGWILRYANSVSWDGKTIVGAGRNKIEAYTEAFLVRLPCIDDCDQCSFTEHMKARCRADGEGTVSVTARLSGAKPGATLTFCLDYWKALATATVKENGRAKVVFDHAPPGRLHHVTLKECDAPADAKCR